MTTPFVHLKVHSEYSIVDGLVRIKPLIKKIGDLNMPAVALTDVCNFYGLVKFYKAARSAGIKPILGSDFIVNDVENESTTIITLLAQTEEGYRNLRVLISRAYQEGQAFGEARVERQWIEECAGGIIALSGAKAGDIGQALLNEKEKEAEALLQHWLQVFGDRFYIELQRTGRTQDESYLHKAVALAEKFNCPVVATNDVRFIDGKEFDAHEARVCINDQRTLDDSRRPRLYSEQQYLRTSEEMAELFSDIPEAIENTVQIARRCNVEIEIGTYYLPDFPVPEGLTLDEFFTKISHEGLTDRLNFLYDSSSDDFPAVEKTYRERLDFELNVIIQMGFPGYFLIVMDFIKWGKDNGVPVGPGRGSGAGSLVAYALLITDLDPLEYDLLFERFLNPERVSMPDFDVDFCMEGRDRVISYVADQYGRDAVSQIITFGTMAAKAVVRDVARVQSKPYGLADKLSKLIPFEVGMTLDKAYEQEEILRDFLAGDSAGQEIWDMALQLEGITRGVGKHAGGVVIAPTKLTDFSPLYCDETGQGLVTQYDKKDVEEVGLVKFDFLGLRTLTIIDWAIKTINRQANDGSALDIMSIPLDDRATFDLLQRADTTAVFQLESRGMKDLIKRLLPNRFEDIIALVALFRPGPLQSGMVDDFINRKHGRAEVAYPHSQYQHEDLIPVLEPTYGIILYQEQVMQIAQVLGNFSLGGADLLRRAMGKKDLDEMARQRAAFVDGATGRDVDSDLASNIFDLMEKFAGYGFNKSHSAAYALVSYQTAWLKVHYPAPFMAAVMSSDMQNTDKVVTFIEECRAMKLHLSLPDVNSSEFQFTVTDDGGVVYGLGAIKGLGEGPVESIVNARKDGPFTDLFDFCNRTDPRTVNKRALEALILSGAFDALSVDRAVLMASLPDAVKAAEQSSQNAQAGMIDLFSMGDDSKVDLGDVYEKFVNTPKWSGKVRLEGEKDTLGLYVTGHPIDDYEHELKHLVANRIVNLRAEKHPQLVVGLIINLRVMKSKSGNNMAFATIDDRTGRIEVGFFGAAFEQCREMLIKDKIVVVQGKVAIDDYNGSGALKVQADSVMTLDQARQRKAGAVVLKLHSVGFPRQLHAVLAPLVSQDVEQSCPVIIEYTGAQACGRVQLSDQWRVFPGEELIEQLQQQFGLDQVIVEYDNSSN